MDLQALQNLNCRLSKQLIQKIAPSSRSRAILTSNTFKNHCGRPGKRGGSLSAEACGEVKRLQAHHQRLLTDEEYYAVAAKFPSKKQIAKAVKAQQQPQQVVERPEQPRTLNPRTKMPRSVVTPSVQEDEYWPDYGEQPEHDVPDPFTSEGVPEKRKSQTYSSLEEAKAARYLPEPKSLVSEVKEKKHRIRRADFKPGIEGTKQFLDAQKNDLYKLQRRVGARLQKVGEIERHVLSGESNKSEEIDHRPLSEQLFEKISQAAEALDKPRRMVTGFIGGHPRELLNIIPFSDRLGITKAEQEITGRRLLEKLGWAAPNTPGVDLGDVGGLVVEVALDPLTYFGGFGLFTKAGKGRRLLTSAARRLSGLANYARKTKATGRVAEAAKLLDRGARSPLAFGMFKAIGDRLDRIYAKAGIRLKQVGVPFTGRTIGEIVEPIGKVISAKTPLKRQALERKIGKNIAKREALDQQIKLQVDLQKAAMRARDARLDVARRFKDALKTAETFGTPINKVSWWKKFQSWRMAEDDLITKLKDLHKGGSQFALRTSYKRYLTKHTELLQKLESLPPHGSKEALILKLRMAKKYMNDAHFVGRAIIDLHGAESETPAQSEQPKPKAENPWVAARKHAIPEGPLAYPYSNNPPEHRPWPYADVSPTARPKTDVGAAPYKHTKPLSVSSVGHLPPEKPGTQISPWARGLSPEKQHEIEQEAKAKSITPEQARWFHDYPNLGPSSEQVSHIQEIVSKHEEPTKPKRVRTKKVVPTPAESAPLTKSTYLTPRAKKRLKELGHTDEEIKGMEPNRGYQIILDAKVRKTKSQTAASNPTPEAPVAIAPKKTRKKKPESVTPPASAASIAKAPKGKKPYISKTLYPDDQEKQEDSEQAERHRQYLADMEEKAAARYRSKSATEFGRSSSDIDPLKKRRRKKRTDNVRQIVDNDKSVGTGRSKDTGMIKGYPESQHFQYRTKASGIKGITPSIDFDDDLNVIAGPKPGIFRKKSKGTQVKSAIHNEFDLETKKKEEAEANEKAGRRPVGPSVEPYNLARKARRLEEMADDHESHGVAKKAHLTARAKHILAAHTFTSNCSCNHTCDKCQGKIVTLVANFDSGKVRRVTWNNKEWLVAPLVMIREGVLNGSRGALFYPLSEIKENYRAWEGVPVTIYHPTDAQGSPLSAKAPGVIERSGIGIIRNPEIMHNPNRLRAEAWIDPDKARKVDKRVLNALEKGSPIEISTGLFTENQPAAPGAHWNGKNYSHTARAYRPDHLAVLIDQVGACNISDGCGMLVKNNRINLSKRQLWKMFCNEMVQNGLKPAVGDRQMFESELNRVVLNSNEHHDRMGRFTYSTGEGGGGDNIYYMSGGEGQEGGKQPFKMTSGDQMALEASKRAHRLTKVALQKSHEVVGSHGMKHDDMIEKSRSAIKYAKTPKGNMDGSFEILHYPAGSNHEDMAQAHDYANTILSKMTFNPENSNETLKDLNHAINLHRRARKAHDYAKKLHYSLHDQNASGWNAGSKYRTERIKKNVFDQPHHSPWLGGPSLNSGTDELVSKPGSRANIKSLASGNKLIPGHLPIYGGGSGHMSQITQGTKPPPAPRSENGPDTTLKHEAVPAQIPRIQKNKVIEKSLKRIAPKRIAASSPSSPGLTLSTSMSKKLLWWKWLEEQKSKGGRPTLSDYHTFDDDRTDNAIPFKNMSHDRLADAHERAAVEYERKAREARQQGFEGMAKEHDKNVKVHRGLRDHHRNALGQFASNSRILQQPEEYKDSPSNESRKRKRLKPKEIIARISHKPSNSNSFAMYK